MLFSSSVTDRLQDLKTTEDAGRSLPSCGPGWDAAVEQGIDVALLKHGLSLAPFERLRRHEEHVARAARVRRRTLPAPVVEQIERRALEEKLAAWGLTWEQVLEVTNDGREDR
jgi:hypothetical protein